MNDDMKKNLDILKTSIQKAHGKGSLVSLSGMPIFDESRIIHSGSIGLDIALGIGGYARGRIIEIYGPNMVGKSTLALHAVANEQALGNTCAYLDLEHAMDPTYAKNIGVDTSSLLFSQPDFGEQALEITNMMCRSGIVSLIVIDSVAALVPKAELEGEIGDTHIGKQARLMSQAMRILAGTISKTDTCVMFINQTRSNIGGYGNPVVTAGGGALKFYASQRLEMARIGKIEEKLEGNTEIIGNQTRVKIVKNKVASPFKEAEFDVIYGKGIDRISEILDFAVMDGLINKGGAWFNIPEDSKFEEFKGIKLQGRANMMGFLKTHQEFTEGLKNNIFSLRGLE